MPILTIQSKAVANPLIEIHESGMGFQVASANVSFLGPDQVQHQTVGVFLIISSHQIFVVSAEREFSSFVLASADDLRQFAIEKSFPPPVEVLNVDGPELLGSRLGTIPPHPPDIAFLNPQPNPVRSRTRTHESFYRYSAFTRDWRVLSDGGLAPGTYSTTYNDAKLVPSGYAAVGRYALPHPLPAKYLHVVCPPRDTEVVYGAVVPNFNQAGGGVEALFPNGARNRQRGFQQLPDG